MAWDSIRLDSSGIPGVACARSEACQRDSDQWRDPRSDGYGCLVELHWCRSLLLAGALAAGVLSACVVGARAGVPHPVTGISPIKAGARLPEPPPANCAPTRGTPTPVVPEKPTGLPAMPSGLIAYAIYQPQKPGKPATPSFAPTIFSSGDFAGVDLAIQWCNLEPRRNRFNWAPIQTVMNEARAAGMFVILAVIPGFESPRWVLKAPGVQYTESSFSYHSVVTPARLLPLPWNTAYLNLWYGFLRHAASEFRGDDNFVMLEAGGPTSVSDEMSLPDWTGGTVTRPSGNPDYDPAQKALGGSDIAMWEALDYDPATYVAAWARTFHMYRKIFPNQYMSLGLIDGLPITRTTVTITTPTHPTPTPSTTTPIKLFTFSEDKIDPNEITATPLAIIAAGRKYGSSFVLQADGLGPSSGSAPTYSYVQGNCGSIDTGFQTHDPTVEQGLSAADLMPGVQAGVRFLEVYAVTAKEGLTKKPNGTVLGALTYADGALKTNAAYCQPLTLTASPQTAAPGTPTTLAATYETGLVNELSFRFGGFAPPFGPYRFTGSFNLMLGPAAPTPTCQATPATTTAPASTTCTTTVTPRKSLTYRATIAVAGTSFPVPVATAKVSIVR